MTMKPRVPRPPASSGRAKRPRRPRTSVNAPAAFPAVTEMPFDAGPGDAIALNTRATWLAFGCLLLAGTLLAFFKTLTLVVVAIVGFCIVWVKLCLRFPRTMFVITAFLRGLLSRR